MQNGQKAATPQEIKMTEETKDTNQEQEDAAIREAFNAAIDSGNDDVDDVKLEMISAGATFKNVGKYYNQFMEDAGLVLTKDQKSEYATAAVSNNDVSTEEGFGAAVAEIMKAGGEGMVTEKSAAGMVRARAKKEKAECYKKPKTAGGTRTTFLGDFYDALIANPKMTEEEAHDFIVKNGTANTLRWENQHQKARALANRIAA